MVDPLMQTINAPAIEANVNAIAAGHSAPYIVNKPFFDSFVNLGGTGATLGLLLAIYLVGRRNKPYMVVTNLSIAPGVFNINEPTMFGLPIVLNPIMFIPFILTPMVLVSVAYFATATGLVPAATVMPPWVTPPRWGISNKKYRWRCLSCYQLNLICLDLPTICESSDSSRKKKRSIKRLKAHKRKKQHIQSKVAIL